MKLAINICDMELIVRGQGTFVSAEEKEKANQADSDSQNKEVANGSTQSSLGSIE